MSGFFKSKINVILTIVIGACVAGIVYVGVFADFGEKVEAIDFSNLKENEVIDWLESNEIENYHIAYQYSDSVEKGGVIYQSVKKGEEITKIDFIISKGKKEVENNEDEDLIELPEVTDTLTKAELEKFFTDNSFTSITYEYQTNDKDKDFVIKMSLSGKVKRTDSITVTLSSGKEDESVKVKVPDFSTYTKSDAESWGKKNSITINFQYKLSDKVERNKIFEQSVAKDKEVNAGSVITLTISDGKGVKIPDFTGKKKEDVETWVKENKIENIKYETAYSDKIEKDLIISSKPKKDVEISVDYPVVITISLGKKATLTVKSGQEGKIVDELKKYIASVSSTLILKDSGVAYYSSTIESGKVHSYDIGDFAPNSTIKYYLSLGKYVPVASEYEGKTSAEAEQIAANYRSKKAEVTFEGNEDVTDDSSKVGKTYGCSVNGNKVTCKVGVKNVPQISASEYNGKTLDQAISQMNTYKNTYGSGSFTYNYGDQNESNKDKTYGCNVTNKNNVSCKVYRDVIDKNLYNDKDKAKAQDLMNEYKKKYGIGTITFVDISTNEHTAGKTYGCNLLTNSYTVQCNFAKAIEEAEIMELDGYAGYIRDSYQGTVNALTPIFNKFTNVTYVKVVSSKNSGYIVAIKVNGNPNYDGGKYPLDTPIVIEISDEQGN